MARKKKIEDELKENEEKVITIEKGTDVQEETKNNKNRKEAEQINEMELIIYNQTYTVQSLIALQHKKNKTYLEKETVNRFVELMYNYYRGIKHAILRECCGTTYTIQDLKNKLKDENMYKIIDIRCSRKNFKFDRVTVDTIVNYIEQNEK